MAQLLALHGRPGGHGWRRLRRRMELRRQTPFDQCACAGKGYDMLMAMRENIKRLWLHHLHFPHTLVDVSEQAHQISRLQSCLKELSHEALSYFTESLQTNCVSGDVATNVAVAQACLLQRQWRVAAELHLLAFSLVIFSPHSDCLSPFWDITASDVVYNTLRLLRGQGLKDRMRLVSRPLRRINMYVVFYDMILHHIIYYIFIIIL